MTRFTRVLVAVAACVGAGACSEPPDRPASRVTPKVVVGDIPCGPDKVLKNVCQFCHTNPPQHDAPFPLVTYANTQAEMDGKPIWFWMQKYVSEEIMPLPPVDISDADRAILLQWLRAGAPPREAGTICDGDGGVLTPDTGAPRDAAPDEDADANAGDVGDAGDGADALDAAEPADAGAEEDAATDSLLGDTDEQ